MLGNAWFGNDESFLAYMNYRLAVMNMSPVDIRMYRDMEEEEGELDLPHLAQIEGNVGIINIAGSLIPNASWYSRMFGMTGYDEIVEAAVALREEGVSAIVKSYNTGGGSVMGLQAATNSLEVIGRDIPLHSNTEGGMLSAGYWMGTIAKSISSTPMAQMGSIGTVITHTSVARALKEQGRDVTIIRSGKYKALGHPAEALTKEAKAKMQSDADKMTGFFREHIESHRGAKLGDWNTWGEGRTFFSEEAISIGLADRSLTLNQLVTKLNSKADKEEITDMKKKIVLQDDQALAQLENGVPIASLEHSVEDGAGVASDTATGAQANADDGTSGDTDEGTGSAGGDEGDTTGVTAGAEEGTAAAPVAAAEEGTKDDPLMDYLKGENKELQAKLTVAEASAVTATTELETMKVSQKALIDLATSAGNRMEIGLRQTPTNFASMSADAVVERVNVIRTQFNETFHVGQKSAAAPVEEETRPTTADGIYLKAVAST